MTQSGVSLSVLALVAALAAVSAGADAPESKPPPAPSSGLLSEIDHDAVAEHMARVLEEKIGEPFPNLTLRDGAGGEVALYELLGSGTTVFLAGSDAVETLRMADELKRPGRKVAAHERVVTLFVSLDAPRLSEALASLGNPYSIGWPLPSPLTLVRPHATLFFVSGEGKLEGFQRSVDARPIFRATEIVLP